MEGQRKNIISEKTTCGVSIIVPFLNRIGMTKACLQSVYDSIKDDAFYEIILVDDASTESYDFFEEEKLFPQFKLVRNEINQGFAKSCNRGAEVAGEKYQVFLNNDTIALGGWLKSLLAAYCLDPRIGVAGNKLVYADQTIQHAGVCFDDDCLPFHIYHRFPPSFPGVNKNREFQAVTGACLMIEADLFRDLGGFDERYLNGMEDIDLCLRVREAGRKVVYACNSTLYHLEAKTRKKNPSKQANNLAVFNERWGKKLQPDYLRYYKEDIVDDFHLPPDLLEIKKIRKEQDLALAVWGAGSEGRHLVAFLRFVHLEPQFFIDSDEKKWGTKVLELPVYSPNYLEDIKKQGKRIAVLIGSLWFEEIAKQLTEMGLTPGKDSGMVWRG